MKFILADHWQGPEDADRYDRNVESNPKAYGLRAVARMDFDHGAYQFDYRVVWQDKEGRLWTARDSGCSCPTPFEDTKELDRLFSVQELHDEFWKELHNAGEYRDGPRLQDFGRFISRVQMAFEDLRFLPGFEGEHGLPVRSKREGSEEHCL